MTAYCEVEEVEAEFKDVTFDSNTAITEADVTRFIVEADAEINGRVGLVYVTPVTAVEALVLLRRISIGIVSTRIKAILAVKTGAEKADQGNKTPDGDPYRKMLTQIVKGDMILAGATKRSTGDGVSSASSNAASGCAHTFKKGEEQW